MAVAYDNAGREANMYRILHLSDLHFGTGHHFDQGTDPGRPGLARAVDEAIRRWRPSPRIDAVILSGDLLTADAPTEAALAKEELKKLVRRLEVAPKQVFCVPGNHDLTWDPLFRRNPLKFYDEIIGELRFAGARRDDLPMVATLAPGDDGDKPLALLLLDSCRVEGEAMAGVGRIGDDQLEALGRQLQKQSITAETHVVLAVFHHHALPVLPVAPVINPLNPKGGPIVGLSHTVDSVQVLGQLSRWGAGIVLHGHQHRAAILKYRDQLYGVAPIHICAAGSCGVEEKGTVRQFFLYEICGTRAEVWNFTKAVDNDDRFDAGETPVTLSLRRPRKEPWCDRKDQTTRCQETIVEPIRANNSDLNYLLLSVVDCRTAREVIRRTMEHLPETREWRELNPSYLRLLEMYDLLGRWDLVVRFRFDPTRRFDTLFRLIEDALIERGMLVKDPSDPFSRIDWLNANQEYASIQDLKGTGKGKQPPAKAVVRQRLESTEMYEAAGLQGGIVFVQLTRDRSTIFKELKDKLEDDDALSGIIKLVTVGNHWLIFEVFTRCGEASLINRLNRVIEPILTDHRSQKYTLTYYSYDEQGLELPEGGGASAATDADGSTP
jgi:3',5'-cyclic AMP phosphodiesterase CpdA